MPGCALPSVECTIEAVSCALQEFYEGERGAALVIAQGKTMKDPPGDDRAAFRGLLTLNAFLLLAPRRRTACRSNRAVLVRRP